MEQREEEENSFTTTALTKRFFFFAPFSTSPRGHKQTYRTIICAFKVNQPRGCGSGYTVATSVTTRSS